MSNKGKKEKITSKFWIVFGTISIILFLIFIIGLVSFSNRKPDIITEEVNGGKVILNYTSSNIFNVQNYSPITDDVGVKLNQDGMFFDFTVTSKLTKAKKIDYEVSVKKILLNTNIPDKDIKIYLEKEDSGTYNSLFKPKIYSEEKKKTSLGTNKGKMILIKKSSDKSSVDHYRLRTWLSDQSQLNSVNYSLELDIKAKAK